MAIQQGRVNIARVRFLIPSAHLLFPFSWRIRYGFTVFFLPSWCFAYIFPVPQKFSEWYSKRHAIQRNTWKYWQSIHSWAMMFSCIAHFHYGMHKRTRISGTDTDMYLTIPQVPYFLPFSIPWWLQWCDNTEIYLLLRIIMTAWELSREVM